MAYFVELNQDNEVIGLYTDEDGYATPPQGAVEVSDEVGESLRLGFTGKQYINGSVVDNPAYIENQARESRITQIKIELAMIDSKKIRPLSENDTAYLTTLNNQTAALRAELATLAPLV